MQYTQYMLFVHGPEMALRSLHLLERYPEHITALSDSTTKTTAIDTHTTVSIRCGPPFIGKHFLYDGLVDGAP